MQLQVVQVYDVCAHRVQEVSVVRHNDERLLPALQVLLQPEHGAQVEMVGGLVQQQQRGLDEERARERDAHAPAAGEGLGRPCLHRGGEAQAMQDLGRARIRSVCVFSVQQLVHLNKPCVCSILVHGFAILTQNFQSLLWHFCCGECHQILLLLSKLHEFYVRIHHCLERSAVVANHLLLHQQYVNVLRHRNLSSRQQSQQRGLALTIGTNQTVSAAVHHAEGCVLHKLFALGHHRKPLNLDVARHVVCQVHLLHLLGQPHRERIVLVAHRRSLLLRNLHLPHHLLFLLLLSILVRLHLGEVNLAALSVVSLHLHFVV
mmetsp:Transcript_5424/g.10351  ORF Transcript_5424/g.10351 Transcript_5424/m.10351 type:complete len:318 (-) Transcript_5424:233-1186(-)